MTYHIEIFSFNIQEDKIIFVEGREGYNMKIPLKYKEIINVK